MYTIYIVRSYYVVNEHGARNIDTEGIFESYEKATEYVNQIKDIDETDNYRIEMVTCTPNSLQPWNSYQVWYYDKYGTFVRKQDNKSNSTNAEDTFCGKFKSGDIVFIKAFPFNEHSPLMVDKHAVVSRSPMLLKDWLENGNARRDWDCRYTVDYINFEGYLSHEHVHEEGLQINSDKLPEEDQFLIRLSEHYIGRRQIKRDLFNELVDSKLIVKKFKCYAEYEQTIFPRVGEKCEPPDIL